MILSHQIWWGSLAMSRCSVILVTTSGVPLALVGRGQRCCWTSYRTQDRPRQQRIVRSQTPAVLRWRNLHLTAKSRGRSVLGTWFWQESSHICAHETSRLGGRVQKELKYWGWRPRSVLNRSVHEKKPLFVSLLTFPGRFLCPRGSWPQRRKVAQTLLLGDALETLSVLIQAWLRVQQRARQVVSAAFWLSLQEGKSGPEHSPCGQGTPTWASSPLTPQGPSLKGGCNPKPWAFILTFFLPQLPMPLLVFYNLLCPQAVFPTPRPSIYNH